MLGETVVKSINFSSRREAGLVEAGAEHGNEETVDLGGKG